jgi:hypothetical protein
MVIGTLNEGSLHSGLKDWYADPGDLFEHPVDGFVADLVRGDLLIEIQTGGFAPLRSKLEDLTLRHRVRLVAPVAANRTIVRLSVDGEVLSRRRSPKHGHYEDVFARLASIPTLIERENLELDVLLTDEEEVRTHHPGRARRRSGWVVIGRRLLEVRDRRLFRTPADLAGLLPAGLPDVFSTADVAATVRISRRLAQQMVYCLRALGAVELVGKRGNALLYCR